MVRLSPGEKHRQNFVLLYLTCSLLIVEGVVEDPELPHDDSHGGVVLQVGVAVQVPHGARQGLRVSN